MRTYKSFKRIKLGESINSSLLARGYDNLAEIKMGKSGKYSAYFVNEEISIPEHYTKVFECHNWLSIYDDDVKVAEIRAELIQIFRAGDFGMIVYAPSAVMFSFSVFGLRGKLVYSSRAALEAESRRAWAACSTEEKIMAYKDCYDSTVLSAKFECAKDPTLKPLLPKWLADAKEKYESAVAAINAGEDVDPPEAI